MKYVKLFEKYNKYEFQYTCVSPQCEEELEAIIDDIGKQDSISQKDFLKEISFEEINQVLPVVYKNVQDFINDWHVRCYIGSFYFDKYEDLNREIAEEEGEEYNIENDGKLIEYAVIVHSSIEHVWKK